MRFYKKKNRSLFFLLGVFLLLFFLLFSVTPGIKGDIEKSIKISLNQPTLFKLPNATQSDLKFSDYPIKLFYAIKNYLTYKEFQNLK